MKKEVLITKVFKDIQNALDNGYNKILCEGTRSSSKTTSIFQHNIIFALNNPKSKLKVIVSSQKLLKEHFRDYLKNIERFGLPITKQNVKLQTSEYHFENKSICQFVYTEDPSKLTGFECDFAHFLEADHIHPDIYTQVGSKIRYATFFCFNPRNKRAWQYKLLDTPNSILIKSTYKDNNTLSLRQIQAIEDLIHTDYNSYRIYALGEPPIEKEQIYTHFKYYKEKDIDFKDYQTIYGLDFSNGGDDETALIEVKTNGKQFYIKEKLYVKATTPSQIKIYLKELNIGKDMQIIADSARPDMVKELLNEGYKIKAVSKVHGFNNEGSITHGINIIKEYQVFQEENSFNLKDEVELYKWRTIGATITDIPIDKHNHLLDSFRYVMLWYKHHNLPFKFL